MPGPFPGIPGWPGGDRTQSERMEARFREASGDTKTRRHVSGGPRVVHRTSLDFSDLSSGEQIEASRDRDSGM
jgi:hypothetical protein